MLRRAGFLLLALSLALVGAAFLIVAFYRWLDSMFPDTLAAAIVGGAMFVLAGALVVIALRGEEVRAAPQDLALAALGFTSRAVRAHPEKAVVAAILAGVLEEWLDNTPKDKGERK